MIFTVTGGEGLAAGPLFTMVPFLLVISRAVPSPEQSLVNYRD